MVSKFMIKAGRQLVLRHLFYVLYYAKFIPFIQNVYFSNESSKNYVDIIMG